MKKQTDHKQPAAGIFCEHGPRSLQTQQQGVLAGKRLAVKDLFSLASYTNSAGNPDWLRTHEPAQHTAVSLRACLDQGAEFVGFTVTDELAFSLQGANTHYGTAQNPKLAGHHCGGSSMGSAAAVAAGLSDIALGTDTGGSVRVPASYCGIYGIRPSHDAVDTEGLIGLAPIFDTIGWFSQNAQDLNALGEVLLKSEPKKNAAKALVLCPEILALASDAIANEITQRAKDLAQRLDLPLVVRRIESEQLPRLNDIFRVLQGRSCANEHRSWLEESEPHFAKDIAERFSAALALSDDDVFMAEKQRLIWQKDLSNFLSEDEILLMPSSVTGAPKIQSASDSNQPTTSSEAKTFQLELRQRLLNLTAIAGLTGSVQIHIPFFNVLEDGLEKPSGFSLLMHKGNDLRLLNIVSDKFN